MPPQTQEVFSVQKILGDTGYKQAYAKNPNEIFGYSPYFNSVIMHKKHSGPIKIFETSYTFDEMGSRKTNLDIKSEKEVIFLGGSNTFGEGVKDNEVFVNLLQEQYKNVKFYNFAYRGWGPDQAYSLVNSHRLISENKLKNPIFLYVLYPYHLYRSLNTPQVMANTKGLSPYLIPIESQLVQKGLMKDSPLASFKMLVGEISFYRGLENTWYQHNNQINDLEFLSSRFQQIKKIIKERYPHSDLIILMPPFGGKFRENEMLKTLLETNGISYRDFPSINGDNYYFPIDRHLNSLGHLKFFRELVPYLSKYLKF